MLARSVGTPHRPVRLAGVALLASVLASALAPAPASAYVLSRNKAGEIVSWRETTCVGITPDAAFADPNLDPSTILAALERSVRYWSDATQGCSYFQVQLLPARSGLSVGYNPVGANVNLVQFVPQGWRHQAEAVAMTTISFSDVTGRLYDADIEMNSQYFRFGVLAESGGETTLTDLENTLVHELGHLGGLDHTCDDGLRMPTPTDHLGQIIPKCCPDSDPSCALASPAEYLQDFPDIVTSTMFNYAPPGETSKRTPERDDVEGFCALYPLEQAPGQCVPEHDAAAPEGGCAVAGAGGAAVPRGGPWLLAALVMVARRQRRRRRG